MGTTDPEAPPSRFLDWAELWAGDPGDTQWIIEPLIAAGQSVAVYSPAKTGKSLLALEIAAAVATGRATLGNPPRPAVSVLYIDHENTRDDLRNRLEALGYGPDDDLSRLHYSLLADWEPLDTDAGGQQLTAAATEHGAALVILDTVSRAISGEENSADTFLALYRHTGRRLKRDGVAMLRLDHSGKDATRGQRGSSAKRDDVDAVWSLLARSENALTLSREASRTGYGPSMLHLRRTGSPLRHILDRADDAHEREVERVVALLDHLDVPLDAGRPTAAKAIRNFGDSARNSTIDEARSRRRLRCPPAVPALSPAVPEGTDPLSPADCPRPPLPRRGQGDSPPNGSPQDLVTITGAYSASHL